MRLKINHFSGLYIFAFASIGVLFPLIGQYLSAIGFTGLQIGVITSTSTAVGIFANPFWGGVYHRRNRNKRIILLLCVTTAVLVFSLMTIRSFFIFLLFYIIIFFFENPIFPLIDSTTLEANYPFGTARKWGAVGFALGIGIAGPTADHLGLVTIFPLFAAMLLATGVVMEVALRKRSLFPSQEESPDKVEDDELFFDRHQKGGYRELLKNRKYMALLFSVFFYIGPSMAHNIYFSFLYVEVGGTVSGMGLALLLMVICEAPVMAWSDRISAKVTTERILLIAFAVSVLRFLWYSTSPGPGMLAATFFLQGFTNGIVLVQAVKYLTRLVRPDQVSLAIPLYTAIASNASTITCQLMGGIIMESFGGSGVYFFFGLFNLVGIAIYLVSGLHRRNFHLDL